MNEQRLDAWYQHAASADGFIGGALRIQRAKAFITREQQRAMLGILDTKYDQFWLRLQAMPLPRPDYFAADLERIVAKVMDDLERRATIDLQRLGDFIQAGVQ